MFNEEFSIFIVETYLKYKKQIRDIFIRNICERLQYENYKEVQEVFKQPNKDIFLKNVLIKKKTSSKRRKRKEPPPEYRCHALIMNKSQCKLSRINNTLYCGRHTNNRQYGTIDSDEISDNEPLLAKFIKYNNREYILDNKNNIYTNTHPAKKIGILQDDNILFN